MSFRFLPTLTPLALLSRLLSHSSYRHRQALPLLEVSRLWKSAKHLLLSLIKHAQWLLHHLPSLIFQVSIKIVKLTTSALMVRFPNNALGKGNCALLAQSQMALQWSECRLTPCRITATIHLRGIRKQITLILKLCSRTVKLPRSISNRKPIMISKSVKLWDGESMFLDRSV